jgi:plasmid stabilization system protein ParE
VKRLRLDAAARAELLHETKYYEATRPDTGRKFREAVDEAFARIKRAPETGKTDEAGCRRVRIKGFPLSAVYREEEAEIVVFAIRPDAREPGYWHKRVG